PINSAGGAVAGDHAAGLPRGAQLQSAAGDFCQSYRAVRVAAGFRQLSQRARTDECAEVLPELVDLRGRSDTWAACAGDPGSVRLQLLRLPLQKSANVAGADQPDRPVCRNLCAELSAAGEVGAAEFAHRHDCAHAGDFGRLWDLSAAPAFSDVPQRGV